MPTRLQLQAASQRGISSLTASFRALSTTSPASRLKDVSPSSSAAPAQSPASILSALDDSSSSASSPPRPSSSPHTPPSSFFSSPRSDATETAHQLLMQDDARRRRMRQRERKESTMESLRQQASGAGFMRQMPRRWRPGDVYAPHDLSPVEMAKWRGRSRPQRDRIDMLGLNPLDMYRNFSMISEYMTPMGRIMHSNDTGLRPVNQRKMAKAIRRAIGLGIHPSVHKHPMLLYKEQQTVHAQRATSNRTTP